MKTIRNYVLIFSLVIINGCSIRYTPDTWTTGQASRIQTIIADVSVSNIQTHLTNLNGIRHVLSLDDITPYRDYLVSNITLAGYDIQITPVSCYINIGGWGVSQYKEFFMDNIVAVKAGSDPALPPVLVCCHWDSVQEGPGISDNATGCAGVLELARIFSTVDCRRNIVFAIFGFEEYGMIGSQYYVWDTPVLPAIVYNMDGVGITSEKRVAYSFYDFFGMPREGDFVLIVGLGRNEQEGRDYASAADYFVPSLKYFLLLADDNFANNPFTSDLRNSDHSSFWDDRVPAFWFNNPSEGSVNNAHTIYDTIDKININHLRLLVQSIAAAIATKVEIAE